MATHSSILAWRIPWTEELGGLQSMDHKESDTTEQLHFTCSFTLLPKLINIQTHLSLPSPLGGKHLLLLLSC